MKLLITGGAGFIGRRTAEIAVERGHRVTVLVRPGSADRAPDGVHVVEGDVADRGALDAAIEGVNATIHCAASLTGDAEEQRRVTVDGTRNLIAALRGSHCRRLVGVGTFACYDVASLRVGETLDESCPLVEDLRGRHPYLAAKSEQERMLTDLGREQDFIVHVLRPGLVHGEGRTWFHHLGARLGPLWLLFAPGGKLPLVHVDACAAALVRAAGCEVAASGPVNVVDPDPPTRRRYAEAVASEQRVRPIIVGLPWALVSLPAIVASATIGRLVALPDVLRIDALSERCKPVEYSDAALRAFLP